MELDKKKSGTDCSDSGRQIRIHPKSPGPAFLGEFVLAEGLGGGAGQQEMRNRPVTAGRQISIRLKRRFLPLQTEPFWPRSWAMELDNKKNGIARLVQVDR
ncbi:hypothetical protein RFW18_10475 [Metabacillus idriensis]|uniref:hypothetical protein n=1 Tax=Metabacillus idriensis TaxID=324768 RepID=UPI002813062B|nr:hypothetical protein [Metabacillus idriensis]MDR0138164.1 hypothetical protein [Metabacillus idriensis]